MKLIILKTLTLIFLLSIVVSCKEDEDISISDQNNNQNNTSNQDDDKDDDNDGGNSSKEFEVGDVPNVIEKATIYALYTPSTSKWTLKKGYENKFDDVKKMLEIYRDVTAQNLVKVYLKDWYVYGGDNVGTLGFIQQDQDDYTKWKMAFYDQVYKNIDDQGHREFVYTSLHEFFHIYSLNFNQLADKDENDCNTLYHPEGCANTDAYIYDFHNKFWKDKEQPNPNQSLFQGTEEQRFVTIYAMTNHVEDIAESFIFFIFRERPTSTTLIRDQKIDFFYKYPEIVKLRDDIRKNFDKYNLEGDRLEGYTTKLDHNNHHHNHHAHNHVDDDVMFIR